MKKNVAIVGCGNISEIYLYILLGFVDYSVISANIVEYKAETE